MTLKNKLVGSALSALIVTQVFLGIYSVIRIGMDPCEFLNHPFVRARRAHRFPVPPLPDIDLDPFKVCIYKRWRFGELFYVNLLIAFGMPSPSSF